MLPETMFMQYQLANLVTWTVEPLSYNILFWKYVKILSFFLSLFFGLVVLHVLCIVACRPETIVGICSTNCLVSCQLWYMLSKTLAEEAAWKFTKENGIDMVTINPGLVIGPLLQPTLNTSSESVLKLINGNFSSIFFSLLEMFYKFILPGFSKVSSLYNLYVWLIFNKMQIPVRISRPTMLLAQNPQWLNPNDLIEAWVKHNKKEKHIRHSAQRTESQSQNSWGQT